MPVLRAGGPRASEPATTPVRCSTRIVAGPLPVAIALTGAGVTALFAEAERARHPRGGPRCATGGDDDRLPGTEAAGRAEAARAAAALVDGQAAHHTGAARCARGDRPRRRAGHAAALRRAERCFRRGVDRARRGRRRRVPLRMGAARGYRAAARPGAPRHCRRDRRAAGDQPGSVPVSARDRRACRARRALSSRRSTNR